MTKDAVASYIGPMGLLFRGIEKLGNGVGDAIGGSSGDYVSSAFSPDEAVMRNNADPDVSTGDKILGTILPFHAAKTSRKASDKRQKAYSLANARRLNSQFADHYELGGYMNTNQYVDGGRPKVKSLTDNESYQNLLLTQDLANQYSLYNNDPLNNYQPPEINIPVTDDPANNNTTSTYRAKPKNILQYAPVLGDFMNYVDARRDRPEVEQLSRSTKRYKPDYVDEAYIQNIVDSNYNNTINALTNASGGSASNLRANILAASANRTRDISDAYFKADEYNRQQNDRKQQFDLGIDQFNIGQGNQESDINARNRAAVEDRKRLSRDAIYRDLGAIGREQTYDNRLWNLTGGYNSQGAYDPETRRILLEQLGLAAKTKDTNETESGGFMSNLYNLSKKKTNRLEEEFNNKYR